MSNIPPISDPNQPPFERGKNQKFKLSAEMREQLGLAPADFLIYAAMSGAASLFYLVNPPLEALISLLCLALGAVSCFIGMKINSQFSRLTNILKIIGYPTGMLIVITLIALNFLSWNPNPQAGFFPRWR